MQSSTWQESLKRRVAERMERRELNAERVERAKRLAISRTEIRLALTLEKKVRAEAGATEKYGTVLIDAIMGLIDELADTASGQKAWDKVRATPLPGRHFSASNEELRNLVFEFLAECEASGLAETSILEINSAIDPKPFDRAAASIIGTAMRESGWKRYRVLLTEEGKPAKQAWRYRKEAPVPVGLPHQPVHTTPPAPGRSAFEPSPALIAALLRHKEPGRG